jgi:hypothetical protein
MEEEGMDDVQEDHSADNSLEEPKLYVPTRDAGGRGNIRWITVPI